MNDKLSALLRAKNKERKDLLTFEMEGMEFQVKVPAMAEQVLCRNLAREKAEEEDEQGFFDCDFTDYNKDRYEDWIKGNLNNARICFVDLRPPTLAAQIKNERIVELFFTVFTLSQFIHEGKNFVERDDIWEVAEDFLLLFNENQESFNEQIEAKKIARGDEPASNPTSEIETTSESASLSPKNQAMDSTQKDGGK